MNRYRFEKISSAAVLKIEGLLRKAKPFQDLFSSAATTIFALLFRRFSYQLSK